MMCKLFTWGTHDNCCLIHSKHCSMWTPSLQTLSLNRLWREFENETCTKHLPKFVMRTVYESIFRKSSISKEKFKWNRTRWWLRFEETWPKTVTEETHQQRANEKSLPGKHENYQYILSHKAQIVWKTTLILHVCQIRIVIKWLDNFGHILF